VVVVVVMEELSLLRLVVVVGAAFDMVLRMVLVRLGFRRMTSVVGRSTPFYSFERARWMDFLVQYFVKKKATQYIVYFYLPK